MATEKNNVQEIFLNTISRNKTPQLVYKHAVSTIMPGQPVQLFEGDGADEDA